ncbi:MAG TPA: hypothetical protein VIL42_07040 [Sphingomicrobium sp.]
MAMAPPPYLALQEGSGSGAVTQRAGYFSEEQGCVVFRTEADSEPMTPVFAAGSTQLATDGQRWLGMMVNDQPVGMLKLYRVGATKSAGAPALTRPAPASCPTSYVVVRSVGSEMADASVRRFCAGVTLCTSFRLN